MAFAASKLQSFSDADLEDADLLAELAELQDEADQPAGLLQGACAAPFSSARVV